MHTVKRAIATTELLLIFPAALFMTALFVRNLQLLQYEPARTAQQVVIWYARRQWTLWVLLIAMPLGVLVIGGATLLRGWMGDVELSPDVRQTLAAYRAQPATLFVAAATLTAGGILVIVVLHMLAN
jgi:hypothetical protein